MINTLILVLLKYKLDILIFREEWDIIVVQNYVWRKIESKLLLWRTTKFYF